MLDVTLAIEGDDKKHKVFAYRYRDELSQPFELEIEAIFAEAALDFESILGAVAEADFPSEPYFPKVRGIIVEIEQLTIDPDGFTHYALKIVPPIALLAHRVGCRIEQDKNLVAIAISALEVSSQDVTSKIVQVYPSREYTVQYNESDLRFAQRMLAEAGVGFFFHHGKTSALTLFDDIAAADSLHAKVKYIPEEGRIKGEPHVRFVNPSGRLRPGRVTLTDYDYQRPQLDWAGGDVAPKGRKLEDAMELFEVEIGDPLNEGSAKPLAKRILEGLRARATTTRVEATFALAAGSILKIDDAPRSELGEELLVIASETRVEKGDSTMKTQSRFTVIPRKAPFRPERVTKPRIWGTQTAYVVGDSGEEIDVDEQARVKVAFHWDRRGIRQGAPTRRIRVSQGWAGPGYGLMNLPRVGDEVVVSFLDGDPDEPIIVGRVHNMKSPPPLQLPANKTQSIWKSRSSPNADGSNHVLLEDLAGREMLELSGQRDVHVHANRNYSRTVGVDETRDVGGHSEEDIKGYHKLHVGGPEFITIDGAQEISIGATQSVDIASSQTTTIGGHHSVKSASMIVESKPIGVGGTTITVVGSEEVGVAAPIIAHEASAVLSGKAPTIVLQAANLATVTAPVCSLAADAVATVAGAASVGVLGNTITITGGATIEIGAPNITIKGSMVNVVGEMLHCAGDVVNVTGKAAVNILGGTVNVN